MTERQQREISEWLESAQKDYGSAEQMADHFYPVPIEIVCYHCQQCVEKSLKGFALSNGWVLSKSHDIEFLIEQCVKYEPDFSRFYDNAPRLSIYATVSRYPPTGDVTEQDMKKALSSAKEILEYTMQKLTERGFSIPRIQFAVRVHDKPKTLTLKGGLGEARKKAAANPSRAREGRAEEHGRE